MDSLTGMEAIFAAVAIASPLTIALVSLAKQSGLPNKLAPISSLFSGVIITILLFAADVIDADFGKVALTGVIAGLTASGAYSGTKEVVK